MADEKPPVDLSHHISAYARRYSLSPLKGLQKYRDKDIIQFAGGLPSADYFPFTAISADVLPADAFPLAPARPTPGASTSSPLGWLWRLLGSTSAATAHIDIPRAPRAHDGGLNLATALQYGPATGLARTQAFLRAFTARVHAPRARGWTTLVHTGNTDGWGRVARVLLDAGDTLLVEEWTYPSALATARPIGVKVRGVAMDGEGMRADSLREVLEGWDVRRDGPRPRVIYTVPVGQNPSGAVRPPTSRPARLLSHHTHTHTQTMSLARKQAIYDVCVEFDLIIAEDDPYFFLQLGEYAPKAHRATEAEDPDGARFLASLVPSFLRVDTQGRVIRIETFSKTIAPGVRLGWFTCAPLFAERLERLGETSAQNPCGLGQALVVALLAEWTLPGYVRWLQGLRAQYRARRDFFVDCLAAEFDLAPLPDASPLAWAGQRALAAYRKGGSSGEKRRGPLLVFVPPSSGMFVWARLHFGAVPDRPGDDGALEGPERQFWAALADAGVLAAPGWFFAADGDGEHDGAGADREVGHLRLSFTPADVSALLACVWSGRWC
ncbi:PLP-dependent transferase [Gloeopeniophorella convolvens]|nr:PLP-dependent transferase [Gloeopeniophorella convolvens]